MQAIPTGYESLIQVKNEWLCIEYNIYSCSFNPFYPSQQICRIKEINENYVVFKTIYGNEAVSYRDFSNQYRSFNSTSRDYSKILSVKINPPKIEIERYLRATGNLFTEIWTPFKPKAKIINPILL